MFRCGYTVSPTPGFIQIKFLWCSEWSSSLFLLHSRAAVKRGGASRGQSLCRPEISLHKQADRPVFLQAPILVACHSVIRPLLLLCTDAFICKMHGVICCNCTVNSVLLCIIWIQMQDSEAELN